jgi:hypothetical protein
MKAKNVIHDIGVASQIGKYSDAVESMCPAGCCFFPELPV